jgi:lipoprotein signal peptidase
MEERNKNSGEYYLLIALLLVIIDQISKILVKGFSLFGMNYDGMNLGESISLIGDFLTITFIENPWDGIWNRIWSWKNIA